MENMYHGGESFAAHIGLCLTDLESVAAEYGTVHQVAVDFTGLNLVELSHLVDRDNMFWPGDTAKSIAQLQAEGVDVAVYEDETTSGRTHKCYRLISEKSLQAVK